MDEQLALQEVAEFLSDLIQYKRLDESTPYGGEHPQTPGVKVSLNRRRPLIEEIAAECGLSEPERLRNNGMAWFLIQIAATEELDGILKGRERRAAVMGPKGPQLSAIQLHPWVWGVAAPLWDDGYRREAIQAAATAIFDSHLRAKLGLPSAKPQELAGAFATSDPTPASPSLRLPGHTKGTDDWKSAQDGAAAFGRGCAMAIRNLSTHSVDQPDEQLALQALAALSLFAQWCDEATVEAA
jgi:hypothetical protein